MDPTIKARLLISCQEGNAEVFQGILSKNMNLVNIQDQYGYSLICLAAKFNFIEIAKILFTFKCDLNMKTHV